MGLHKEEIIPPRLLRLPHVELIRTVVEDEDLPAVRKAVIDHPAPHCPVGNRHGPSWSGGGGRNGSDSPAAPRRSIRSFWGKLSGGFFPPIFPFSSRRSPPQQGVPLPGDQFVTHNVPEGRPVIREGEPFSRQGHGEKHRQRQAETYGKKEEIPLPPAPGTKKKMGANGDEQEIEQARPVGKGPLVEGRIKEEQQDRNAEKGGEADAVIGLPPPAPIKAVKGQEEQRGTVGPELGEDGDKERLGARCRCRQDMPALVAKTYEIILDVPDQNGADHDKGDPRRQVHPGGVEEVVAFLQQEIYEQGRQEEDGSVFGQAGQAEEDPQHDKIPPPRLSPRSRGDVFHRRHEGKDEQEEEAVGQEHNTQGIEEEGAVDGHDGQEGDQRGTGKGEHPSVEEQRDGGKEQDRRQPHQEFIRSEQFVKGPVDPAHQGGVIHVTQVQEIGVEKIMGLIDTQAEGGGHQQAQ